ncbi:Intersectin-1-like [Oopsacas minuta]|uniref:Intersectin-1-like n=1 Tax=Oopsacas minuta TaxID=111878 RepID=A0AAV7K1H8_9METZ|nr:Intersectin-1-like [Oopsacas minuta]
MAMFMEKQPLERYRCLFGYSPKEDDELELEKDDIVLLAQKFTDGWGWGLLLRNQSVGAFPLSILKHEITPILRNRDNFQEELDERSSVIRTLYFSEFAYKNQIDLLHYYVATLELQKSPLILNLVDELKEIVLLHDLSYEMSIQLSSRVAGWDNDVTLISNVFSKIMPNMRKLFQNYAEISPRTLDSLVQITKNASLNKVILSAEENCIVQSGSRVSDSMKKLSCIVMSPLTQLCKYQKLMELLRERTPETHPDYYSILSVSHELENLYKSTQITQNDAQNELKLSEIVERFGDERLRITEDEEEPEVPFTRKLSNRLSQIMSQKARNAAEKISMQETMKKMSGNKLYGAFMSVYDQPHNRYYICEGNLRIKDVQVYLFLFRDTLLIAQLTTPKLKLMYRINLTQSWITDMHVGEEMVDGFRIGSPDGVYTCVVQHKEMKRVKELKDHWMKTISSCIADQKKKLERVLSVYTVPTNLMFTVEATSRMVYIRNSKYELNLEEGDKIQIFCIFDRKFSQYRPGLHIGERYQDPSIQWYYGMIGNKQGWFPKGCVSIPGNGTYNQKDVKQIKWNNIVQMKKNLSSISELGFLEVEDKTIEVKHENRIKKLTLPASCTITDVIDLYFANENVPNRLSHWSIVEVSKDGTYKRKLNKEEDPSSIVNFWGQGKEEMQFFLEETINH